MYKLVKSLVLFLMVVTVVKAQDISSGEVISRDLLTTDSHKAAAFYEGLFGWKAVDKESFIVLKKEGEVIATIFEVNSKKQPIWVPIFAHDNLSKAKAKILEHGGSILRDEKQKEGIGDYLLARDSEQALLLITLANSAEVKKGLPELNSWLWDEIWSHDMQGSETFYKALFDYEVEKTSSGYVIFKHNKKWLAGLLDNPYEKSQTQWVSTVRVDNPEAVAQKAVALGGRILVGVEQNKGFREEALLADPTGAVFIVQKYEWEVK